MKKRYEILKSLPTYGDMAIPITHNDEIFVSEGYVVKFYRDDRTEWIANFQLGWTETSMVISNDKSDFIIVIAGGTSYVMNPNEEKPIRIFDYGISEIIQMDNGDIIISSNETDIIILDETGRVEKRYDNISDFGFRSLKLDGDLLKGLLSSYDPPEDEWLPFNINIKTDDIHILTRKNKNEKEPWWKFW